jgi:hydrogenase maturation factor HypE
VRPDELSHALHRALRIRFAEVDNQFFFQASVVAISSRRLLPLSGSTTVRRGVDLIVGRRR